VGATSIGTRAFYAWADNNQRIALIDSRHAHNADKLAGLPRFVAINSALQVDLGGNVNLTSRNGRIISGPGGAGDFAEAGARSEASIIVLFSTTRDGLSTIAPQVEIVTLPASHLTHIVTEHGIAHLRGRSREERAQALAAIAAPEHREQLLRQRF
jgi:4-hydroxybutyrate CoA-transferase